jgi:crotonyl-CoA carboxylase/reductase
MIDLCELGERPPLGEVPTRMHAFLVRQNRFGQPRDAWRREVIPTPTLGPDEVLVYVMASGINYNNVWAALGTPVDVIAERQRLLGDRVGGRPRREDGQDRRRGDRAQRMVAAR